MLKRLLSKAKQKIDQSFNQFVAAVFVASQLLFPMVAITPAHATSDEKVRICHATHSGSNPFTNNEVNDDAIDGNGNASSDHNRNDHQDGEDIIPPFYVNGDPGTWTARNWDAEGQAIWNNDCSIKGSIKVIKDTQPNDTKNFEFNINQDGQGLFEDFELEDDGDNNDNDKNFENFSNLSADDYVITEDSEDDWRLDSIVCTGADYEVDLEDRKVTVKLDKAENAECTFANKPKPTFGSVKVNKKVDADGNGVYEGSNGTADSLGFAWGLDAETADNGMGDTQSNVPTGNHTVKENDVSGYEFTGWYKTADEDNSGSNQTNCNHPQGTTLPVQINVEKDKKTDITLCNQKIRTGDLKVVKDVINDDGGSKTFAHFTFTVDGGPAQAFEATTSPDGQKVLSLAPGTYTVVEPEANTMGYTTSYNNCTEVTVVSGQTATCTITNDDKPATIYATKIVCDSEQYLPNWGNGTTNQGTILEGTADAWLAQGDNAQHCQKVQWQFQWDEEPSSNPGDETGVAGGEWQTFDASTEVPVGSKIWVREVFQDGYLGFTGQNTTQNVSAEIYCHNDILNYDNWDFIDKTEAGQDYYCIAWNVLDHPTLTLEKKVIDDNGSDDEADEWTLRAHDGDAYLINEQGNPVNSHLAVTDPATAKAGVIYELSEVGPHPDGYTVTWECNGGDGDEFYINGHNDGVTRIILEAGEDVTCRVTNNDKPAKLTVTKEIVGTEWGGDLEVTDFPLYVNFTGVVSGQQNEFDAGLHVVWEIQQDGYNLKYIGDDCAYFLGVGWIDLEIGQEYDCKVVNEAIPGTITVYKKVINDNGGHKDKHDFELYVGDTEVDSGDTNQFRTGIYSISEDEVYGYEQRFIKCYEKDSHDARVRDLLRGDDDDWKRVSWEYYGQTKVKLDLGEDIVCVIVNDDIPPRVVVTKHTWDEGIFPQYAFEKFKFEVENLNKHWDDHEFYLDTNLGTHYPDDTKTVEMKHSGLIKVSERYEHGWATYVKCEKRDQGEITLQSNFYDPDWPNFAEQDRSEKEWLGVGDTLYCDFYNVQEGKVLVTKFQDNNENGHWDKGEAKLPGWDITLDKKVGFLHRGHWEETTNEHGFAVFKGLLPNDPAHEVDWSEPFGFIKYKLGEEDRDGWRQTNTYCLPNDHHQSENQRGILNFGWHGSFVEVDPGETTFCFIGNVPDAQLLIEKSNNATDALTPGQTVTFTIKVTNPADNSSQLEDVMVHDLLPLGLSYVDGTATIESSLGGSTLAAFETVYAPGVEAVWVIGSLATGETKTLTYTVVVDDNTAPGTYTNIAWTLGQQCSRYGKIWTDGNQEPEVEISNEQFLALNENQQKEFGCKFYNDPVLGNGNPFVYSSVTVAAVQGETDSQVLAETGTPAILAPFVGLTLAGTAVLLGGGGRRLRRLLGRFNRSMLAGLMSLALMVFSVSPALAAATDYWTLRVADLADTTSASSLTLPYSVANTNSSGVTTVNLDVNGPGSNDHSDSYPVMGSEARSFTVNLPVDGTYKVTVSATNATDTPAGSNINPSQQTIVRDTTPPAATATNGSTSVTQNGNEWTVAFTIPEDSDAETVKIYASTDPNFTANESTLVAEVPATPGALQQFVHTAANAGALYFAIRTVDGNGNHSEAVAVSNGQTDGTASDDGVVDQVAATDEQTADDSEGQEQGATDDQSDSNNTALVIIGLAAVAGALYYVFGRRSGIEE